MRKFISILAIVLAAGQCSSFTLNAAPMRPSLVTRAMCPTAGISGRGQSLMGRERRKQKQQRMGRLCKWWKETREARSLQMTEDGGLQDATMPEDAELREPRQGTWRYLLKTATWPQLFSLGGCLGGVAAGAYLAYRLSMLVVGLIGMALKLVLVEICRRFPLPFCFWMIPTYVSHTISLVIVSLIVIPSLALIPSLMQGSQLPEYKVIDKRLGGSNLCQLRRYDPFIVAEVEVTGTTSRDRFKTAFQRILAYVQGKNRSMGEDGKWQGRPERLDMSGMMTDRRDDTEGALNKVGFVLPKGRSLESLPRPEDKGLRLREFPGGTYASVTLRGPVPDDDVLDDMADTLRDTVKGAGLQIKGPPLICQILPTVETEVMFQTGGEGESSQQ